MPWNGSGTFSLDDPPINFQASPISSSDMNSKHADFVAGLNNTLTRDGQASSLTSTITKSTQAFLFNGSTSQRATLGNIMSLGVLTRAEAAALTVTSGITVLGCYHGGVLTLFEKDASGTALTTADGQKWSPMGGNCTPAHWGGSPGSTNDATTAVQAAFTYAITKWSVPLGNWEGWVNFAGLFWRCTASIDACEIRQPDFRFGNGGLFFDMTGGYGLQMFGSNRPFIVDPFLIELPQDPTACPEFGFCFGVRQTSGGGGVDPSPGVKGTIRVDGHASKASILNLGSEVSNLIPFVHNPHPNTNAFCYAGIGDMQDAVDVWGGALTSSFCTLPTTGDGAFSNILHDFGSAEFKRSAHWVATVTGVTQANPAVVSFTVASAAQSSRMANGQTVHFDNTMGGMTELKRNTYTMANLSVAGDGLSGTFELSGVDSTLYVAFSSDGAVARHTKHAVLFGSGSSFNIGPASYLVTYGGAPILCHCRNGNVNFLRFSGQAEKVPRNIVEFDVGAASALVIEAAIDTLNLSHPMDAPFKITRTTGSLSAYGGYVNIGSGSTFADELCTGGANFNPRNFTVISPIPIDLSGLQTFSGIQIARTPQTMRWYMTKNLYVEMTGGQWTMPDFYMSDKLIHAGDTDTAMRFPSANTWTVETAGTEVIRASSNQRIGINEDTPNYLLDVNGTFGFTPGASVTPIDNGDVVFQLTSDTQLTIKARGSDGTARSVNLTLA